MCVTYSECVSVSLIIQHKQSMRHIILLSVACLALLYFSKLYHKRYDFRKKVVEQKFMLSFSVKLCLKHFFILRKNAAMYCHKCTLGLRVKCALFLSDFNDTSIFRRNFRKIFQ